MTMTPQTFALDASQPLQVLASLVWTLLMNLMPGPTAATINAYVCSWWQKAWGWAALVSIRESNGLFMWAMFVDWRPAL